KVRLAVTIADPPGAPALSVDADAVDRDGDGLEDLSLRVAIEGGGPPLEPGPRVSGVLAWLDRPAGLSRDLGATEGAFAALVANAHLRAARPKDAPAVPSFVTQVRALYRAMCAEAGAPRLAGVVGTGAIACGASKALEQAGLAETRAYATEGDALRAALALDRAGKPPAARTPPRETEAQAWITAIAPAVNARAVRAIAAVPEVGRGHEPAWGPLAFEAGGKLLVRTRAGRVRVDPETGDEASADGAPDWSPAVASPDGAMRWIETYDPCDGMPLHASFASAQGDDLRDLPLPVPAPLGDRCAGSRGAPARAMPLAWGASGLEAVVEGEPILVAPSLDRGAPLAALLGQPFNPGAPRSPDGSVLVVPTGSGLLVRHGAASRVFRALELEGTYADLRDCAVSNEASRVACTRTGKAWVGTWEAF
ncbi:MAG: hypothetical protein JOZ69_13990, partial [Myxococcales bacterium]|nr:hypothetical protein [Myxococcales bacterium]